MHVKNEGKYLQLGSEGCWLRIVIKMGDWSIFDRKNDLLKPEQWTLNNQFLHVLLS
jgi:hypothetical protein